MRRERTSLRVRLSGGLLSLATIGLLLASASSSGVGTVTCAYSNADHILAITATDAPTRLVRSGNDIQVDDGTGPISCTGGNPNVHNTDRITVSHSGRNTNVVDLGGGPFGPGFTTGRSGSSGITIQYLGRSYVDIRGTPGPDHFGLGAGGVNLNGGGDLNVIGEFSVLLIEGRGGDEVIAPQADYVRSADLVILNGVSGDDTLIAPPEGAILHGGSGDDLLIGSRKADNITGGTGRDVIRGGGGRDLIRAIDGERDVINCRNSVVKLKVDGIDKLKKCGHARFLRGKRTEPVGKSR
jgi:Ca2+-binding RTX toxin-like protein